jgi:hypothetical protein
MSWVNKALETIFLIKSLVFRAWTKAVPKTLSDKSEKWKPGSLYQICLS